MRPINFSSLLSSTSGLNIPVYQREYRWDVTRASDLIRDAINSGGQDLMVGLVVSVSTESSEAESTGRAKLDIVDGQQRFTTISLTLSVIEGLMNDVQKLMPAHMISSCNPDVVRIGDMLVKRGNVIMTGDHPDSLHWSVYETLVTPIYALDRQHEILNFINDDLSAFEARMKWLYDTGHHRGKLNALPIRKNIEIIHALVTEHVDSKRPNTPLERFDVLKDLGDKFQEGVTFIHYQASHLSQAFSLFETLNDRGMQVASSDLIKNLCMKELPSKMEEIANLWSSLFGDVIDEKLCIYFFRTWNNSSSDFITTQKLYRAYEQKIQSLHGAGRTTYEWLDETVKPEVERMASILGHRPINDPELANPLVCLQCSSGKQWHSVAMSALRLNATLNHHGVTVELGFLMRELGILMAVMEVTDTRGSIIERFLPEVAVKIDAACTLTPPAAEKVVQSQKDALLQKRRDVLQTSPIVLGAFSGAVMKNNSRAMFLLGLLRLKTLTQGLAIQSLSLEHVYPQKPNGGDWPNFDPLSTEEKERLCYSLGNLVQLSIASNAAISNGPFVDKKDEFDRVGVVDACLIQANKVREQSDWDPTVIDTRAAEIDSLLVGMLTT